jgi:uncharacterized protein YjiS (DUF1127 family)
LYRFVTESEVDRVMQVIQFERPAGIGNRRRTKRRSDALLRGIALVEGWIERHWQRRALLGLSDHVLKDIGVSRSEAQREGRKSFWLP